MEPAHLVVYKRLFRLKMSRALQNISEADKKKKSRKIFLRLVKSSVYKKSEYVFIYASTKQEANTWPVIADLLKKKKRVFIPLVIKDRQMKLIELKNTKKDLKKGAYGILEPKNSRNELKDPSLIDLAIIPGLAFDQKGRRLGRGAGYFDRFLKRIGKSYKIGIAFKEQMHKEIPRAAHDISMDKVITD